VLQVVAQQLGGTGRGSKAPGVAFLANSVRSTNLVELRTRGRDPLLTAKAANIWAEVVAAQSEALFSTEAQQSFTFFERQLREATDQFTVASRAQRDFNARSQVALLQARVTSATEQISSYQSRLIDISVALRRAEVELNQVEAQLRLQPKTLTLSKSITTDPFLHQAATQGTRSDFSELSKLQLKTEEINPVYIHVAEAKADLAVRVASLRAEQGRVATVITQLTRTLELLRGQLATQQLTQTELTRSVENARQVYGVLLQRREEARLASTSQSGSARLVAAAIVPDVPVAPRRSLSILVGLALGLMAGAVLAFVMEHITAASQGSVARPASVASAEVPSVAEH
jgi:succinoglycan biosynthesis transport protein ExoP